MFKICTITVVMSVVVSFGNQNLQAEETTVQDIFRVIKNRENSVESIHVRYLHKRWTSKKKLKQNVATANRKKSWGPEELFQLWISGEMIRIDRMGPSEASNQRLPTTEAFDGTIDQTFNDMELVPDVPGSGVTITRKTSQLLQRGDLSPFLNAVRPSTPWMLGEHPDHWRIQSEVQTGGHPMVVLTSTPARKEIDGPGVVKTVSLDPRLDYSITSLTTMKNGTLTEQSEYKYDIDSDDPWIPTEWKIALYDRGELAISEEGTLEHVEMNPDIPKEQFHLTFPAGTVVVDRDRDEQIFEVQADGTQVLYLPNLGGERKPEEKSFWPLIAWSVLGIVFFVSLVRWRRMQV